MPSHVELRGGGNGSAIMKLGKYKGNTVAHVAAKDPGYALWAMSAVAQNALFDLAVFTAQDVDRLVGLRLAFGITHECVAFVVSEISILCLRAVSLCTPRTVFL